MIRLSVLGETWVLVDDVDVTTKMSKKTLGLLLYMICRHQKMYYREALSSLFWPDYTKESALNNLRHAIWQIRKFCKEHKHLDVIESEGKHIIKLDFKLIVCDFLRFNNLITEDDLMEASVVYKGDFLIDYYIPEVPEFSDWVFQQRELIQKKYFDISFTLAERFAMDKNFIEATRALNSLTKIDPLNEEIYYKLIYYQNMSGNKVAAINTYRTIKRLLRDELSISPSLELQKLYKEIYNETNASIVPSNYEIKSLKSMPHHLEIYSLSDKALIKDHYRKISKYKNSSDSLVLDICEIPGKRVNYEGMFELLDGIQENGKYNPKTYMNKLDEIITSIKYKTISNDIYLFDRFNILFEEELSKQLVIRVWGLHFLDAKTIDFISFICRKTKGKIVRVVGIYDTTWPNTRLDEFLKAFASTSHRVDRDF